MYLYNIHPFIKEHVKDNYFNGDGFIVNPLVMNYIENNNDFDEFKSLIPNLDPEDRILLRDLDKYKINPFILKVWNNNRYSTYYNNCGMLEYWIKSIFNILQHNPLKLDWILEQEEIDWRIVSMNPTKETIEFLKKNYDKINWYFLSLNTEAIELLSENLDKISFKSLSINYNAIDIIKNNMDKIDFFLLHFNKNAYDDILKYKFWSYIYISENPHPEAIKIGLGYFMKNPNKIYPSEQLSCNYNAFDILIQNPKLIDWFHIWRNPSIFIKVYNYDKMKKSKQNLHNELLCYHIRPDKSIKFFYE